MKKYLPFIILGLGVLSIVIVFFVVKGRSSGGELDEDMRVPEIPFEQRPMTSLIPSDDGHWLTLLVENISVANAASMDYELLYMVGDGRTQGVPGNIKLDGSNVERELLLGSESSGKFRYDEGVEEGTLTLRFRNEKGKLVGKLSTNFHLQMGDEPLTSLDDKFTYELDSDSDDYFVTMMTFGVESPPPGNLAAGPYGVFSSAISPLPGEVTLDGEIYYYDGSWQMLDSDASDNIGVFIGVSSKK